MICTIEQLLTDHYNCFTYRSRMLTGLSKDNDTYIILRPTKINKHYLCVKCYGGRTCHMQGND